MRNIPKDLLNEYDLEVYRSQYNRNNFILDTNKGKYILRKVNTQHEQIIFMYEAINHLYKNGFTQTEIIYPTKKNLPYVTITGQTYILQSHKNSLEIEFKNTEDIIAIIKLLANFHKCGLNLKTSVHDASPIHMKDVYSYFTKRIKETNTLKKAIQPLSQKTEFEAMFLKDYKDYLDLENLALMCINENSCTSLIKHATTNRTLAHNEYKYHSVGKTNSQLYLLNIDKCGINMQIQDLSSILSKIMQKNSWDIEFLKILLTEYENIRPLSIDERAVLKALLIFPEKFASMCNNYLQCKRRNNYSMFLVKWENMLVYKEKQLAASKYIKENL
ncbi:CotS family spore coat protein [Candidatus Epulonipiscium viviparus]|uniref:CotS family spore coat protein n=1 Tax=Candidatus Epulonipiscium viviparus TaxID=420336 RepID=UPI0027380F83|nr:CotS family spore coat protein [Candidatus Epulopiscium viviparus]